MDQEAIKDKSTLDFKGFVFDKITITETKFVLFKRVI